MDEHDWLAERFEEHRTRLRAVAYRMLGSPSEADDAVQEAWLRLGRSDADGVENLGGWLTTVVARVCLNMLRSRRSRREESLRGEPSGARMPDPVVGRADGDRPRARGAHGRLGRPRAARGTRDALPRRAARVRAARHVRDALRGDRTHRRTLARPRRGSSRAAHDAGCGERPRSQTPTPPASGRSSTPSSPPRAAVTSRRCSRCSTPTSCSARTTVPRLRSRSREVRGARTVAGQALTFSRFAPSAQPALVNGAAGAVSRAPDGRPFSVMGFTVAGGKIVEIDILADPERLDRLDLSALDGWNIRALREAPLHPRLPSLS